MNTKSNMYHNKIDKQFTNYIYRVNVHILLDSGLITRKVIGIYNNNLVTIDNEYIPISNIKDIYK